MTTTRLLAAAVLAILVGLTATASAYTNCTTTCYGYGNSRTCNTTCY